MGAKTWMLVIADGDAREALERQPALDRDASRALAEALFPGETLELIGEGDLSYTNPPDPLMFIGCFPGVAVIAASEFAIDHPSQLPGRFLDIAGKRRITLHAMHSVVDWFAFAVWEDGRLIRSLSLSPDSGILEDIGEPLPFEAPYWAEQPRATIDQGDDAYPLPFHPLELGEEVLLARFGYQLEGRAAAKVDPFSIPLLHFQRSGIRRRAALEEHSEPTPWWKFW
ncbi:DUF6928 family protein [Mitsuaria sp. 7]|uniref:DUF6928 family protein n=1 Tax=Mitsuaria sp. 7 TaxID=1658665 RepID=UPI000834F1B9|nr:hypothetical protein [Mitsuaria sp. 7]